MEINSNTITKYHLRVLFDFTCLDDFFYLCGGQKFASFKVKENNIFNFRTKKLMQSQPRKKKSILFKLDKLQRNFVSHTLPLSVPLPLFISLIHRVGYISTIYCKHSERIKVQTPSPMKQAVLLRPDKE